MRHIENWDDIQEQTGEFERPEPGGYIARIVNVEDLEDKEYLLIEWDYDEGRYKGENQETFNRAGFWPCPIRQSYKEKAMGFFKGFKTSVECSNSGYVFDDRDVQALVGKRLGVVTGEEEYEKNDGTVGTRLYVAQKRSVQAIQTGDFKVPKKKLLSKSNAPTPIPAPTQFYNPSPAVGFAPIDGESDLPF